MFHLFIKGKNMTVLIAKNEHDKIILAADTMAFHGYMTKDLAHHKGIMKIMLINGMHYSSCGKVSEIHNFRLFCSSRKPETSNVISIQKFFVDFSKYLKELNLSSKAEENAIRNNYFLVFEKKLFHFCYGGTEEIFVGDYATDGFGHKEAYMAMRLGKSPVDAIKATIELNVWAGGEPQVVEIEK